MKLWDLYKTWERGTNQGLKVIFKKEVYDITNIEKELWDKEVKAFYFEENTLVIRL